MRYQRMTADGIAGLQRVPSLRARDRCAPPAQIGLVRAEARRPSRRRRRCSRAIAGSAARDRPARPAACRAAIVRIRSCIWRCGDDHEEADDRRTPARRGPRPTLQRLLFAGRDDHLRRRRFAGGERRRQRIAAGQRRRDRRAPTPAARPDSRSRQRRITRSIAGSRSRTIDDGVVDRRRSRAAASARRASSRRRRAAR